MARIFAKTGNVCVVFPEEGEPEDHFLERGWFIISQEPKTSKEKEEALKFSRLWINYKHLNCTYPLPLLRELLERANRSG